MNLKTNTNRVFLRALHIAIAMCGGGLVLLFSSPPAWAVNWNNSSPEGGDWSDAANWAGGVVPNNLTMPVHIGTSGPVYIHAGQQFSVQVLTVGGPQQGSLYIQGAGAQLTSGGGDNYGDTFDANIYILDGGSYISLANNCIAHYNSPTSVVTVSGAGSSYLATGYLNIGHSSGAKGTLNILGDGSVTATQLQLGTVAGSTAIVNVNNGTLSVGAEGIRGNAGIGIMNLYGSGSTITSSGGYDIATVKLTTNILVDSTTDGNSPVAVSAGTIFLNGGKLVTAYGMATQNTDNVFTIFDASAGSAVYSGTFPLSNLTPNLKIVSDGSNTGDNTRNFVLGFDEDSIPVWDISKNLYYYTNSFNQYDGWVLPINNTENFDIIARFTFDSPLSNDVSQAFISYLNGGLKGTGETFALSALGDAFLEVTVSAKILNENNVLGWGLTHFNNTYGTNILLEHLRVPEPATWGMLAAGMIFFLWRRKRR